MNIHKQHLVITGKITNPPKSVRQLNKWVKRLVEKIDMKILSGPHTVYCDKEGNRGITSLTAIETSHIAIHVWDEPEPAIIEVDVFSCKDFNPDDVFEMLGEFGRVITYQKDIIRGTV